MRAVTIVIRSDLTCADVNVVLRTIDRTHDVVLLNEDVEVPHDGWLERLHEVAHAAPRNGIVGCRLVLGDGRLLHAGTFIRADTCRVHRIGALEMDLNQFAKTRVVEGIDFACAYLKREMLDDVGLLSEDTDYCLRAAENGWAILCCGSVTMLAGKDSPRETNCAPFRAKWGAKLEQRYTSALTWQSAMNVANGYAMSTRAIVRALDFEGVRVDYRYIRGRETLLPPDEPCETNDALLEIVRARHSPRRPEVAVTFTPGDVFATNPARRRIGFTMLEVDGAPAEWVRQANGMDEVWTPTELNRQSLIASGVKRPVYVIPLGIDAGHFHPAIHRIPSPRGEYVFVTNFEWGERMNPELLLRTFNRTFRRNEPVLLVCKVNHRDGGIHVPNAIRALGLDERGGRVYFIYNRELPYDQLAALYRSGDCFVSASRGEGWGLPLLEAMACGLPAIATDWGGHTAFLDPTDTYPLRVRSLVPATSRYPYYKGFRWADADGEHLSSLMRHVLEHQDEARERGLRASARVRATLTWSETARRIVERLG